MAGSFIWFLICSCKSAGAAEGMLGSEPLLGAMKGLPEELDSPAKLLIPLAPKRSRGSDASAWLYDVETGAFAFKDDDMLNILSRSSGDILLIISDASLSMSGVGVNPFSADGAVEAKGLSPLNEEAVWTIFLISSGDILLIMLEAVLNMSGDISPALPPLRAASVSGSVLEMKFWNVLQAKEKRKRKTRLYKSCTCSRKRMI